LGCSWILPAVFKNLRELVRCLLGHAGLRLVDDLLKEFDCVELVRQLESLDAAGQLGDRFGVFQCVQRVRAAFVLLFVVRRAKTKAAPAPMPFGERLDAELLLEESSQM